MNDTNFVQIGSDNLYGRVQSPPGTTSLGSFDPSKSGHCGHA